MFTADQQIAARDGSHLPTFGPAHPDVLSLTATRSTFHGKTVPLSVQGETGFVYVRRTARILRTNQVKHHAVLMSGHIQKESRAHYVKKKGARYGITPVPNGPETVFSVSLLTCSPLNVAVYA